MPRASRKTTPRSESRGKQDHSLLDTASRWEQIAVAAYFRAQARGFTPGGELDDWLAAESEVG